MFDVIIQDVESDFARKIGKMDAKGVKEFVDFMEWYSVEDTSTPAVFYFRTVAFDIETSSYIIYVYREDI